MPTERTSAGVLAVGFILACAAVFPASEPVAGATAEERTRAAGASETGAKSVLGRTNNLPGGQPLVITSTNGATFEGNKAVWFGNVLATDREMELMCEVLTVHLQTNSGSRQIESIIAETNVVIAQKDSWAFGDLAVYTASNDVVTLYASSGEVLLDSPDFYLIGPRVVFDRKTGKFHAPGAVTVGGSAQGGVTNTLGIGLPGAPDRSRPAAPSPQRPPAPTPQPPQ